MKCISKLIRIAGALTAVAILTSLTFAQTFRGRVEGVVSDESKAVVSNASVTLTNVNTAVRVQRQSSDSGLYLFDNVDPGTYSVTVELAGFNKFIQTNILVQSGGDVTVNAMLKPGNVTSNITVTEAPVAVEFNSSNKDLTIDTKMAAETPRLDRNPFKLSLLAPSAINTRGEMQPYHSWSMNSVDLGGGTNLANDLQVDGSPIGLGHKGSYPPNTDAIQEVIVSQNSVDAEVGHSAGGLISMTTKAGTNAFHGNGFYLGRYPWLSATADRTTGSLNSQRQHMMGGTFGNPIIKNKLFNFASVEYWKVNYPNSYVRTVPTSAEAGGDFSQSMNIDGGLRTIFDPWTTKLNPTTGDVNVQAFPGNKLPASRFDPLTSSLMKQFWAPNNPGDNITGVNNYKKGFMEAYNYYNWSERADYNINDNWKVFGRIGRYYTDDLAGNPTPQATTSLYVPTGTLRAAWQVAGDVTWTVNPRTVVDIRGDWHKVVDAYVSTPLDSNGWSGIWNNDWFKPYTSASTGVPLYFPHLQIGGSGYGGGGFYWDQRPQGESFNVKISQQRGSHYLKAGLEFRASNGVSYVSSTTNFNFNPNLTANTFNSPDTLHYGDEWATFLLGGLDGSSQMIGGPAPDPHTSFYGMYFQDDWKVTQRLTVNLGLRNDYELPWSDPAHNFSKGLDLSQPIPQITSNLPNIPKAATDIVGGNYYKWNGQWVWTSKESPGTWNAPKLALQPRAGFAFRVDDKTSIRAGYARYTLPTEFNLSGFTGFETVSFLEPPYFGVTSYQNTAQLLQGVPQQTFSNPFPSTNPLLPILGKAAAGNVGRGQNGSLLWYKQDFKKAYNDRLNISFQRQMPGQVIVMASFFTNFGHQLYNKALNQIDPQVQLKYQNTLNQNVANPFYHYLDQTVMPGPLYNQQTVPLSSLLVPYPQYSGLAEFGQCCARERYNSLELRAQKAFSRGWNFLFAYVYINEKNQINFNDQDVFANTLTWQDSNQPHHRISGASTYEIPVGRGRTYLTGIPKAADFLIGGWKVVGAMTLTTGDYPRFGNMIVTGDPCSGERTPQHWFNTSAFSQTPANTYVLRANPLQYGCLTGPKFFNLDGTLSKAFKINDRFSTEFKMAAYNATNKLNRGDPNTDIYSSTFGQALYQGSPGGSFGQQGATYGSGNSGRQLELGLKIIF
ncbi:MAG: TonB-dependent receptor [Bryobacteraceae bacterium]